MNRWMIAAAGCLLIAASTPLAAEPGDGEAFRTVITAQLDAIGRDDAATAQSFAAPGIKQKFSDAGQFLDMVKRSYAPLVRPKSTRFETAPDAGAGPMEKVTIVDSNGIVWTALYTFQQVDGEWRITGCALLKAPDTSA